MSRSRTHRSDESPVVIPPASALQQQLASASPAERHPEEKRKLRGKNHGTQLWPIQTVSTKGFHPSKLCQNCAKNPSVHPRCVITMF